MFKNQSGFAHILFLLLILVGIVVGVYLVLHPTFFKPKASNSGTRVEICSGTDTSCSNPITETNSPSVNLKLVYTLPQSSLLKNSLVGKVFAQSSSPTISVSPTSIQAGGVVTVSYSGIANPTKDDWIGLDPQGKVAKEEKDLLSWVWTSTCDPAYQHGGTIKASGSCSYPIPANLPSGNYTFSLNQYQNFGNSSGPIAAVPFIVQTSNISIPSSSPYLITNTTAIEPGGKIAVSWSGIASPTVKDWVGLYVQGAATNHDNLLGWFYTSSCNTSYGGQTAESSWNCNYTIPGNLKQGNYELHLFSNDGFTVLTTSPTLTYGSASPSPTASPSPSSAPIPVSYKITACNEGADACGTNGSSSHSLKNATSVILSAENQAKISTTGLIVPFDLSKTGIDPKTVSNNLWTIYVEYDLPNGQSPVVVSNQITYNPPTPTLTSSATALSPGGTITVSWSGISNPTVKDWIGLYPQEAGNGDGNHHTWLSWLYTSSCNTTAGSTAKDQGSCSFPIPGKLTGGNYEVRLLANDGFTSITKSQTLTYGSSSTSCTLTPYSDDFSSYNSSKWTILPPQPPNTTLATSSVSNGTLHSVVQHSNTYTAIGVDLNQNITGDFQASVQVSVPVMGQNSNADLLLHDSGWQNSEELTIYKDDQNHLHANAFKKANGVLSNTIANQDLGAVNSTTTLTIKRVSSDMKFYYRQNGADVLLGDDPSPYLGYGNIDLLIQSYSTPFGAITADFDNFSLSCP